jgi:hypothetical protein
MKTHPKKTHLMLLPVSSQRKKQNPTTTTTTLSGSYVAAAEAAAVFQHVPYIHPNSYSHRSFPTKSRPQQTGQ